MLLTDAVTAYVADRSARGEIGALSARQLAWRLNGLAKVCPDGLEIAGLDRDHVRAWQRAVGAQRPASRRAYLSTVRVFLAWCADEGLIAGDPTRGIGRVREPDPADRALTAGQLKRLALVLPDRRAVAVVGLMSRMGLRCCEVADARLAGWDRAAGELRFVGKNAKPRRVAVPPDVAQALAAHVGGRTVGPLIGGDARRVGRDVVAWMAAAGLKTGSYDGMSAHALRHTAATNMYRRCRDVQLVKELLGHSSIATTDRYLKSRDLDAQRAALGESA